MQVLAVQDGEVLQLEDELPELQARALEIYPQLPARLSGSLDLTRFTLASERLPIIALGVMSLLVVGFSLSIPIITNTLVSQVLPQSDYSFLVDSLAVVSLIIIASVVSQYVQAMLSLRLEIIGDLRLQSALWDRLTKLPLLFIRDFSIGDLASRVSAVYIIRNLINAGTATTLLSAVFSLAFFSLMVYYNAALALWAGLLIVLIIFAIFRIGTSSVTAQDAINPIKARIANFAYHSICGIPQIRTLGSEAFVLQRWMDLFTEFASLSLRSNLFDQSATLLASLLGTAGSLLLFTVIITQVLAYPADLANPASISSLIAFYAAFITFCASMSSASTQLAQLIPNVVSIWKRCESVLYQPLESGYEPEAIRHPLVGHFSLNNVSFKYPGSNQFTFKDLSFDVRSGSYVAITGPSGGGKSTLLKLITGLMDPTTGEIMVDGIPLRLLAVRHYRRQLGIVIQGARLESGTILEVVRGGRNETEEAVWESLEMACVANDVRRMPLGLQTQLLNGGNNISGGQRQRLALARALLPKPKVLLLDEATSAIDNISQQQIADTINALGMTRIAIAHRLSTLRGADHVIVVENGTISQQGSFDQLLEQDGYLRRMVRLESPRSA
jgi:ABC-type bacteriocin/lantibiotic exporter with double-glycine peptidase domain